MRGCQNVEDPNEEKKARDIVKNAIVKLDV